MWASSAPSARPWERSSTRSWTRPCGPGNRTVRVGVSDAALAQMAGGGWLLRVELERTMAARSRTKHYDAETLRREVRDQGPGPLYAVLGEEALLAEEAVGILVEAAVPA